MWPPWQPQVTKRGQETARPSAADFSITITRFSLKTWLKRLFDGCSLESYITRKQEIADRSGPWISTLPKRHTDLQYHLKKTRNAGFKQRRSFARGNMQHLPIPVLWQLFHLRSPDSVPTHCHVSLWNLKDEQKGVPAALMNPKLVPRRGDFTMVLQPDDQRVGGERCHQCQPTNRTAFMTSTSLWAAMTPLTNTRLAMRSDERGKRLVASSSGSCWMPPSSTPVITPFN